jgi:hypothetical protein
MAGGILPQALHILPQDVYFLFKLGLASSFAKHVFYN